MTQKSASRASAGETEGAIWHKSSYSGLDNGCVERGKSAAGWQGVRDTKDRGRGTLVFEAEAWQEFVTALRNGTV